jgi:orotate phosphoribosyltransferase-like protein
MTTLLHQCAALAADGVPRDEIAFQLSLSRQMVDWIMDSDSFAVVLQRVSGHDEVVGE